jgi:hypothetical protein
MKRFAGDERFACAVRLDAAHPTVVLPSEARALNIPIRSAVTHERSLAQVVPVGKVLFSRDTR